MVISWGSFNILSGSREVSPIAFLNIERTRETICWIAVNICSPRNISQPNVEISSFFVARRFSTFLLVIFITINVLLLSQVIIECQKHDDYQEAIRWFLDHFNQYTSKVYHDFNQGGGEYIRKASTVFVLLFSVITEIKLLYQESNLELAIAELRTLLERFANNKLMDLVIDAINALIDDTRRDESLREWFKSIDAYIRKVFLALRYHIFALIRCLIGSPQPWVCTRTFMQ